ncbi:reverse transcriptase domain-containing protein, partial [Tanacetum coccineum]
MENKQIKVLKASYGVTTPSELRRNPIKARMVITIVRKDVWGLFTTSWNPYLRDFQDIGDRNEVLGQYFNYANVDMGDDVDINTLTMEQYLALIQDNIRPGVLAMPSHFHKKFHWGTVFATGRRSFIDPGTGLRMKRKNHRTRVPIDLYPCHIEEKMTIKEVRGESVMEWKTKVTTKEVIVIKFPGKFHGYKLTTEEEVEENEGLKEVWEKMEYVISDSDSDLESTARNGNGGNNGCSYKTFTACNPKEFDGKGSAIGLTRWIEKMESVFDNSGCTANQRVSWNDFKAFLMEEFCPSNEMEKLENKFWNHTMVGANHVAYTDRFHELAKVVPHLVTLESSHIKRYINGLAPQICGMLRATQPTTIQSAILTAGILTDEAVR